MSTKPDAAIAASPIAETSTPAAVAIAAAIEHEASRTDHDSDVLAVLAAHILRVDAAANAWEVAAKALGKLATARAQAKVAKS